MDTVFTNCDTRELIAQVGTMNVLAISGGRIEHRPTGVTLPVAYGYAVTIDLAANDTYTVRRVFRGTTKREWSDVYCDEVGETAYQASCFRDA